MKFAPKTEKHVEMLFGDELVCPYIIILRNEENETVTKIKRILSFDDKERHDKRPPQRKIVAVVRVDRKEHRIASSEGQLYRGHVVTVS